MLEHIIPLIFGFMIGLLTYIIIKVSKNNPKVKQTIMVITLSIGVILMLILISFFLKAWFNMKGLNS